MGLFGNKTVTLFNCAFDEETEAESYFMTVLKGVDLVEKTGSNVTKDGMNSTDSAKLYISITGMDKTYIPPMEWSRLLDEEKKTYFTFWPTRDFFVKGDCTGATLPNEKLYEWMRNNFDDVYKVTTVDKYEDVLPHFEVGGL